MKKPITRKSVAPVHPPSRDAVPLAAIKIHPELKPRALNVEFIDELVEDIGNNGMDTPISVWSPERNSKKLYLIAGAHRRAALKRLAKGSPRKFDRHFKNGVPVDVRHGGTVRDALAIQIRENLCRTKFDEKDSIPYLTRMKDELGMSQTEIARFIGKSNSWVTNIMLVSNAYGEKAQEVVTQRGEFSDAVAVARKIRKQRRAGKSVTTEQAVEQLVGEREKRKSAPKAAAPKRVNAKTLWTRYNNLPRTSLGEKLNVLESAFKYLVGETEELPEKLCTDADEQ